jgi:hypothetical protein
MFFPDLFGHREAQKAVAIKKLPIPLAFWIASLRLQ